MESEKFLKIQKQLEKIFESVKGVKHNIIREVLENHWNPNDHLNSIQQTIKYLQLHNQLQQENHVNSWWSSDDLNEQIEPWIKLVNDIQEKYPNSSTVKIENILKDYWLLFPDYNQVLLATLQDPRLTGIPTNNKRYQEPRVQKMNDGRIIILSN